MNTILCGFKKSGKSTIGVQLANKLNVMFWDTDALIERIHHEMTDFNLPCSEIYTRYGEAFFREIEKHAIHRVSQMQNVVIALGGGSLIDPCNGRVLKRNGKIFYLNSPKAILKKRIFQSTYIPAFLKNKEHFDHIFEQRKKQYELLCDQKIDIYKKSQRDIIEEILLIIKNGKQ